LWLCTFFGYEVEKEKLYTVELPNPNFCAHLVLSKNTHGNIGISIYTRKHWRKYENTHLTEVEIKKDFDWAWQFAEEVKK